MDKDEPEFAATAELFRITLEYPGGQLILDCDFSTAPHLIKASADIYNTRARREPAQWLYTILRAANEVVAGAVAAQEQGRLELSVEEVSHEDEK